MDRPIAALGLIACYAVLIAFTDNFVRVIAAEAGLWQFHATRTVMALAVLALVARPLRLRLRPVRWRSVAARSSIHAAAMVIYFGALAFLPVAVVAAGLFTAPIFVLLIGRVVYRQPITPLQIAAVALGFAGVVMVLGPQALAGASLASVLPVVAGALYAVGNVATRAWCAQESAEVLAAGFFAALGAIGLVGMAVFWVLHVPVADGAAGFLARGPVWPGAAVWGWILVQAVGSLLAVGLMVRGYQITTAANASIFEYLVLPASALWSWILWGEVLGSLALAGMALIAAAGAIIMSRVR